MFESILELEIQLILWIQSGPDWLTPILWGISQSGEAAGYMLLLSIVYWCIDAKLGTRMGLLLIVSVAINSLLRQLFLEPRPFWLDTRVQAWDVSKSFGMPSGHSQVPASVWGLLMVVIHRRWFYIVMLVFIFLVGFSRPYLGAHLPSQVIVGWAIGLAVLWSYLRLEEPIVKWLQHMSIIAQLGLALLVSVGILAIGIGIWNNQGDWTLPESWFEAASVALNDDDPIDSPGLFDIVREAGMFLGLAAGAILVAARGGFDAGGRWWKRLLRYLVGIIMATPILAALELSPFGDEQQFLQLGWRYLASTLFGFWMLGGAPVVFKWLKLVD